jgi:hypothetical protein
LIKKAGLTIKTGKTGAVTLIQRFGGALNLKCPFCKRAEIKKNKKKTKKSLTHIYAIFPKITH